MQLLINPANAEMETPCYWWLQFVFMCTMQKTFVYICLSRMRRSCIGLSADSTNAVGHNVWLQSKIRRVDRRFQLLILVAWAILQKMDLEFTPWIKWQSRRMLTAYSHYTYSVSTKKRPPKYNGVVCEILGKHHWNFYNRILCIFLHCVQKFVEI